MIVQPPSPTKDLYNEGDELLIDFEKILFLAKNVSEFLPSRDWLEWP